MRRLSPNPHRADRSAHTDRGAATVFLVLAMAVIFIGAGFAIDVGRYVFEARSAQNSADATALAVATDCAYHGAPTADYSPYHEGEQSISSPSCGDGEATVAVSREVDNILLRQNAGSVNRSATASWDPLAGATTIPLVFSDCEFQFPGRAAAENVLVYLDDTKPQSGCSSLPGGFSQLRSDNCETELTAGENVLGLAPGKPGADLQKVVPCILGPSGQLPHDVLIPLYSAPICEAIGCKGNGEYPIVGFAAFTVRGYSFNGNAYGGDLGKKCPDLPDEPDGEDAEGSGPGNKNDPGGPNGARGKYCLIGDFTTFATSRGVPGEAPDFGAYVVYLTD